MQTMQFRDYIFHHNPYSIEVSSPQAVTTHLCPGRGEVVQGMGELARTVVCRGSFFGDSYTQTMAQLTAFHQRSRDGGAGMLYIPGMSPFMARLRDFSFDAQGDGRVINYTMQFVESRGA